MDTYGKCGDLDSARDIFNKFKIPTKPSISSMSMLKIFEFIFKREK
jgi:hypothetical protein